MSEGTNLSNLKARLGPVDEVQIRLLLQVSPAQRLQTMLEMQAVVLNTWHARLRQSHPELSDLELCRLMFNLKNLIQRLGERLNRAIDILEFVQAE